MGMNEADTRYHLIDPVLRGKGYVSRDQVTLETILTPAPVEPSGSKGRRRKGPGRTDYLLCVHVGAMPKPLPVAVLEAKKEGDDPLRGMQQAKGYADCKRFDVKYVFSTNGHRYGEFDGVTSLQGGPFPLAGRAAGEVGPHHGRLCGRQGAVLKVDEVVLDALAVHGGGRELREWSGEPELGSGILGLGSRVWDLGV